MFSGTTSAPPAPASGSVPAARIKTAATNPFSMPWGIQLEVLSGQNWSTWSGMFTALLQSFEEDLAYPRLYCSPDVYSTVESDVDFPSFTEKFDCLRDTYGGVGSTAIFDFWVELLQARLDDTSPLAPQLAKLTETRIKLSNSGMGVSHIQYCLILLSALPESYEVVASTLLASGPASSLEYSEITTRILVGIWAGHIQRDCRKKKRDEAEKEKKGEESSSTDDSIADTESEKVVNVFERVHA
ncbi:hypothetical protein EDB89DRAFT_2064200 [Lactarius sanguifluus]|nr:hypothetical protein EDB89DRAFT_2064200 [Lactarius sanguifluus]